MPEAVIIFEPSLSISPSIVYTGNNVILAVNNGESTTYTATISYGDTVFFSQSFTTGSISVICSKTWFETLAWPGDNLTLSVRVTGGTRTLSDSFVLMAGDDMKPTVATPTATCVQPASASSFASWIANISKAKVSAAVTLNTSSALRSVQLAYPVGTYTPMTYNSSTGMWEATTLQPITGSARFTVVATDERGLVGASAVEITDVVPYTFPSVVIDTAYTWRCNSSGTNTAGGAYYRIKATANIYTALTGNSLKLLTARIKNIEGSGTAITSGVQSGVLGGSMQLVLSYTIIVTVQDQLSGQITREITLDGNPRNLCIKAANGKTQVGIGMEPEQLMTGGCTLEIPPNGKFFVGGTEAPTCEIGTSGDWVYRKWSNGALECWAKKTFNLRSSVSVGSLYLYYATESTSLQYPFEFEYTPVAFCRSDKFMTNIYQDGSASYSPGPSVVGLENYQLSTATFYYYAAGYKANLIEYNG